jgi:rhamnose transport system permease protein
MTATPSPSTTPAKKRGAGFAFYHEAVLVLLIVAVLILARILAPDFLAASTQLELLTHVYETALIALPMTLIIITGGIDLSVGSTMALSAVVLGLTFQAGLPLPVAVVLALVAGTLAGALNGIFVAYVRVHPLLITLATLAAYRGIAEGLSKAQPVSGFPPAFVALATGGPGGLTWPGILFIVAALLAGFVLSRTPFGLFLYAIGYNETASRFSGVPVARIKLALYTLAGTAAALASVLFVARRNTAKADIGTGMELDVIAMVVLGGTSIFGGRGRILGTVLGILLIHETREFVRWQWNRDELNLIVLGVLLIVSVLLNRLFTRGERESH